MACGLWPMAYGLWPMAHGLCPVPCALCAPYPPRAMPHTWQELFITGDGPASAPDPHDSVIALSLAP